MNKKAFSGLPNLYEDTKQTLEEWEKYIHKNELKTFIIFALYRLQSFLSIHVMMIYHIFVHNKPLLDFFHVYTTLLCPLSNARHHLLIEMST